MSILPTYLGPDKDVAPFAFTNSSFFTFESASVLMFSERFFPSKSNVFSDLSLVSKDSEIGLTDFSLVTVFVVLGTSILPIIFGPETIAFALTTSAVFSVFFAAASFIACFSSLRA